MTSWLKVTKLDGSEALVPIDKIYYIDYDDEGRTRIHVPGSWSIKVQESLEEITQTIQYLADNGAN